MGRKRTIAPEGGPSPSFLLRRSTGEILNAAEILDSGACGRHESREPVISVGSRYYPALPARWRDLVAVMEAELRSSRAGGAIAPDSVASALVNYRIQRLRELHAASESEVRKAVRRIESAAQKLLTFANIPKGEAAAFEAAWARYECARGPWETGARSLRDELYPALTLLQSRAMAMRKQARKEAAAPRQSFACLVRELAALVRAAGGRATASRGIARKEGQELTAFCRAVKAALEIADLPPPCAMTDQGLSQAVLTALKARS